MTIGRFIAHPLNLGTAEKAIRPILAHFPKTSNYPEAKHGFAYFDARLWLYPKTERVAPNVRTIWDVKSKLFFRDLYDPGDKRVAAIFDSKGILLDNHLLNGGGYVCAVKDENGSSLLSENWKMLREMFST